MKLVAISGSLRKGSLNTALLHACQSLVPNGFDVELISIAEIPLFNADVELAEGVPAAVERVKDKIKAADGLLIGTPEYNHGVPGVLKNAIDWLSRPRDDIPQVFGGRAVGIIGASSGRHGALLAQTAWLPVFTFFNARLYCADNLHLPFAGDAFDERGELVDEKAISLLRRYMQGFCNFAKQ